MMFSYRYCGADDETVDVQVVTHDDDPDHYRITVGDVVFEWSAHLFHHAAWVKDGGDILLQYEGCEYRLAEAGQRRLTAGQSGDLRAPMAGKIIRVLVQPEDAVQAGEPLLILEAMKMEQQIVAPQDGVVDRILCQEGQQVTAGTELVVLRQATAPASKT
jgi:3-methylcrotonyl-CoA carboxylase alpha subunit